MGVIAGVVEHHRSKVYKTQLRNLQDLPGKETGFLEIYHSIPCDCFKAEGTINMRMRVSLRLEHFNFKEINMWASQGPRSPGCFWDGHLSSSWQLVGLWGVQS